jgi:hypothetical protein
LAPSGASVSFAKLASVGVPLTTPVASIIRSTWGEQTGPQLLEQVGGRCVHQEREARDELALRARLHVGRDEASRLDLADLIGREADVREERLGVRDLGGGRLRCARHERERERRTGEPTSRHAHPPLLLDAALSIRPARPGRATDCGTAIASSI